MLQRFVKHFPRRNYCVILILVSWMGPDTIHSASNPSDDFYHLKETKKTKKRIILQIVIVSDGRGHHYTTQHISCVR